jgi:hypothetical protein
MESDIDYLVAQFSENSLLSLAKASKELGVTVQPEGLVIADTSAASIAVLPALMTARPHQGYMSLLVGYFRSKGRHFKPGYYDIKVAFGKEGFENEARWVNHAGEVTRTSTIWWTAPKPSGASEKIVINSVEVRPLLNGTSTTFVDGTIDIRGVAYHFFLYLF